MGGDASRGCEAIGAQSDTEYTLLPVDESIAQVTAPQWRGMKKPTFLGVNPWFFILNSIERKATIWLAVHPGLSRTYRVISSSNLRLLASL